MITRRGFIGTASSMVVYGAKAAPADAPSNDSNRTRIMVGFQAGGVTDSVAKIVATNLQGKYSRTVEVENKIGASGQSAIAALKDAPPDGSSLLLTPSSILSIAPFVHKSLPYKPLVDIRPVSMVCKFTHGFAVGPAVPSTVRTINDFLSWARDTSNQASFGSPGAGSMAHLIAVILEKLANAKLRHFPYQGSAAGMPDLLGGKISAMSAPVGDFLPHLKSGKIRILAISASDRSPFVPDVPTFRQSGHPISVREWLGMFLPGKAADSVVFRAAEHLKTALREKSLIDSLAQHGLEVQSSSPNELADLLAADAEEWKRLIRLIGFASES